MEKKEYIEPSMIVRTVAPCLLQSLSNTEGGSEQFSKENFIGDEGGSQSNLEIRDVWED